VLLVGGEGLQWSSGGRVRGKWSEVEGSRGRRWRGRGTVQGRREGEGSIGGRAEGSDGEAVRRGRRGRGSEIKILELYVYCTGSFVKGAQA
jgi:hypothetical protein